MNRGATAAVQAEWAKSANEPAHLVELRFDAGDGGTIYLTDSYRSVTWNGNTYLASGDVLGFSGLQESAEMRVAEVMVQLSASTRPCSRSSPPPTGSTGGSSSTRCSSTRRTKR
jgi:hypothetical protein